MEIDPDIRVSKFTTGNEKEKQTKYSTPNSHNQSQKIKNKNWCKLNKILDLNMGGSNEPDSRWKSASRFAGEMERDKRESGCRTIVVDER